MKSNVFIRPIEDDDLTDCVRDCFDQFGGVGSICKGNVFIKFNGTGPDPNIITDREVILSTVKVVKEVINPENIYVMENSAVGFCTRLVYEIDNLEKRIEELGIVLDYAKRIRNVRSNLRLNQDQFAQKLNEKPSLLRRIEAGKVEPTIKLAKKIQQVYKIKLLKKVDETEFNVQETKFMKKSTGSSLGDIAFIKKKSKDSDS